jgi:hypothetical protein
MAETAVARVNEVRKQTSVPYAVIAARASIAESTLRRWRTRTVRQLPVLNMPGPRKMKPLDMQALMNGMQVLHHGHYRTAGAPALLRLHEQEISRRDFYNILNRYRARLLNEERAGWWRYEWLKVGAVWSLDDMDFGYDEQGSRLRVHDVMDIGSRYMFEPVSSETLPAEKVAANLDGLFKKHGAPIFVKSDCGSNLIVSDAVAGILSKWSVIPLLSPPRYPQYNGVMERGQSDSRQAVEDLLPLDGYCARKHFRAYLEAGTFRRNHICRDTLNHQNACYVFNSRNGEMKTNHHQRREIYGWIEQNQKSILTSSEKQTCWEVNAAWRSAAEEWLLNNKVIKIIAKPENLSTNFKDYERS